MALSRLCSRFGTYLLFAIALELLALAAPSLGQCVADNETLCLNNDRFAVEVDWRDFQGSSGVGTAVPFTSDSGLITFFDPDNVEMLVKVLDGCGVNRRFWVFFAATTTVELTVTVTDTIGGATQTYRNPLGRRADTVADTGAFSGCDVPNAPASGPTSREVGPTSTTMGSSVSPRRAADAQAAPFECIANATTLCLGARRFQVQVSWEDFQGNTGVGQQVEIPGSGSSGLFFFFAPDNLEMLIKVLDGCALNDHHWVFFAATTTLRFEVIVTDTYTGERRTYRNALGRPADARTDTAAFATCDGVAPPADVEAVPQVGRRVSKAIPKSGGVIATTGADGTKYTLTFPAGALARDEMITITPLTASTSRLDGGVQSAVQLEPSGLQLLQPATLKVRRKTGFDSDSSVGFFADDAGRRFHLASVSPSGVDGDSELRLAVPHFSIAGIGGATCADIERFAAETSGFGEGLARQRVALLARQVRDCPDAFEGKDATLELAMIYKDWYEQAVLPWLNRAAEGPNAFVYAATSRASSWLQSLLFDDLALQLHPDFIALLVDCPLGRQCFDLSEAMSATADAVLSSILDAVSRSDRRCRLRGDDDDSEALDWLDLGFELVLRPDWPYQDSLLFLRPDPFDLKQCGLRELVFAPMSAPEEPIAQAYVLEGDTITLNVRGRFADGRVVPLGDSEAAHGVVVLRQPNPVPWSATQPSNDLFRLTGRERGQGSFSAGIRLPRSGVPFPFGGVDVGVIDLDGAWDVVTLSTDNDCEPPAPIAPPEVASVQQAARELTVQLQSFGAPLRGRLRQARPDRLPTFVLDENTTSATPECDAFFADVCSFLEADPGCQAIPVSCQESQTAQGRLVGDGDKIRGRSGWLVEAAVELEGQRFEQECEGVDEYEAIRK